MKERKDRNYRKKESDIKIINIEPIQEAEKPVQKKVTSNREFAKVTYLFVALFLVLMGYIVYFTAVRSKDIINSSYNVRLDSMADRVVRGKILDKDGNVLAETIVNEDGTETRNYPYGKLYAHVVGYDSMGKAGLESTENFNLLTSNAFFLEKISKTFQEEKNIGDNIVTTLDTNLQKVAYNALGNYNGAVIVMDASTGKVLAMVSKPTFDPNRIVSDWENLTNNENGILVNRAMQGSYAPGSVFKLVTTLEYMRENRNYAQYAYECESEITKGDTTIHCAGNHAHGEEDLGTAFANSCNTSYANMGLQLDLNDYRKTAENLLFNSELPKLLPYTESKFQLTKKSSNAEIMMTAIGQGKTQVSPYHMTLLSAAIANGGTLMKPYLVEQIENYTGTVVKKTVPKKYEKLMTSQEASQLKAYMEEVVQTGTAKALRNNSYSVAGKTGTAEYSNDKNKTHSWFTGFTNVENPELVITVIVESTDNSGMSAVSVAKKVLNAYYL